MSFEDRRNQHLALIVPITYEGRKTPPPFCEGDSNPSSQLQALKRTTSPTARHSHADPFKWPQNRLRAEEASQSYFFYDLYTSSWLKNIIFFSDVCVRIAKRGTNNY